MTEQSSPKTANGRRAPLGSDPSKWGLVEVLQAYQARIITHGEAENMLPAVDALDFVDRLRLQSMGFLTRTQVRNSLGFEGDAPTDDTPTAPEPGRLRPAPPVGERLPSGLVRVPPPASDIDAPAEVG